MEGHMYHAAQLGMKYIWFTDHDIRMGKKPFEITSFDFEEDSLWVEEENGRAHGFGVSDGEETCFKVELTKENCFTGTQCMKITAKSDSNSWKGGNVFFKSNGKRHCSSLMAGIKLELAVMAEDWTDCRLILDVRMSQRPPEHECAHLFYVLGDTDGFTINNHESILARRPHTAVMTITPAKGWQKYTLNLSEDVLRKEIQASGIGGLDNGFDTLSITLESRNSTAVVYMDDFKIHVQEKWEAVREVQKKVAKEKGFLYGITPFVGTEISAAGPHKNCFFTKVPIIPYDEFDYNVTHEDAIAWVKKYGGIFALNHPFEKYKGKELTDDEKEEHFNNMAEEFIKHRAWGATLMEVGFPLGRGGFSQEMHLRLWDKLTEAGIFLTGYGSSDNHSNRGGWYEGNNFATWLGVPEEEEEPVREDAFIEAMKSGRCYTGNPVVLKGSIRFETEEGVPMGAVLVSDALEPGHTIHFVCEKAVAGWKFRLVHNGQVTVDKTIEPADLREDDTFTVSYFMKGEKAVEFVRAELYDADGTCIMLTNPIHFVRRDLSDRE